MQQKLLPYGNSTIAYSVIGSGPNPVIGFHGYGEESISYGFFEKYAGQQFTFYAIDLPYHGRTRWQDERAFTVTDLQKIVGEILSIEKVDPGIKLTLMGFSLGGRIALSLYQSQPQIAQKIVLLAPDGLKVNFWYWLSTQTIAGNKFFAYTMKQPKWFFGFLKMLNNLKLVNASVFKFVNYYIEDKEARKLLYDRWTTLSKLTPNLEKIKRNIRQQQTPVRLIYGKHDRIILSVVGEKFQKGIAQYCTISIIPSGHQVLHEKHAGEALQALRE